MRVFVRVMATLVAFAIVIGIGAAVYNAGVTAGMAESAQAVPEAADTVLVPYGYRDGPYWHGPLGSGFVGTIVGIFALIFVTFVVLGLLRLAFGGGRRGGPGGPGGWSGRRAMFEDMHRELHRGEGPEGEPTASS